MTRNLYLIKCVAPTALVNQLNRVPSPSGLGYPCFAPLALGHEAALGVLDSIGSCCLLVTALSSGQRRGSFSGKHFANPSDLRAYAAQLFFDPLVATVNVVDAIQNRLAVGDQ